MSVLLIKKTAAQWVIDNTLLLVNQLGEETDTGLQKEGYGLWNSLDYSTPVSNSFEQVLSCAANKVPSSKAVCDSVSAGDKVDSQGVGTSDQEDTTSLTFVDVPDLTLTTKNFGENGKYQIEATLFLQHSQANVNIALIISIDGVDVVSSLGNAARSSATGNFNMTVFAVSVVGSAKIIKARWKTYSGTASVLCRVLKIFGVPSSNVL